MAAHANNLASTVAKNLEQLAHRPRRHRLPRGERRARRPRLTVTLAGTANTLKANNVILATGSVPFVPPGVQTDGKTVFTSDEALKLEWVPDWIAIVGSGYIGLEFSDVYTALGSEVTFVEAMPRHHGLLRQADRAARRADLLVRPRNIDGRTNVFASEVPAPPLTRRTPPHTHTRPPTATTTTPLLLTTRTPSPPVPLHHVASPHHAASPSPRRTPVTTPHLLGTPRTPPQASPPPR